MPSRELTELLDLVAAGRAAMEGRVIGIDEHRARYRKLGAMMPVPEHVACERVDLGGVAAERLVPAGAGDLAGLPPTLIDVGDHECLLDDATVMGERLAAAGVDATVEVWPEMVHVWHFFAGRVPEADDAVAAIGRWLRPRLGFAG